MNQDVLSDLQELGFSDYEARAYVGLLENGPLTGYQLARVSGVPRPNVYPALDRLQARGAVQAIQVKDGVHYAAMPARELLERLSSSLQGRIERAEHSLARLQAKAPVETVWNIQGYENVLLRARAAVDGAASRLIVGLWAEEARHLADSVAAAAARGIEVTTLCIQGCPDECGGCQGDIYRYPVAGDARGRWLVLAVDDRELLLGQVAPDGTASGIVTTLEVLVAVAGQYVQNSIAAAEIVRSLGPKLPDLLDGRAARALLGPGLGLADESWMDRLLAAVVRTHSA